MSLVLFQMPGDKKEKGKQPARYNKYQKCGFCGKENPGHYAVECPEMPRFACGKYGDQSLACKNPKCFFCGESGHRQRESVLLRA